MNFGPILSTAMSTRSATKLDMKESLTLRDSAWSIDAPLGITRQPPNTKKLTRTTDTIKRMTKHSSPTLPVWDFLYFWMELEWAMGPNASLNNQSPFHGEFGVDPD